MNSSIAASFQVYPGSPSHVSTLKSRGVNSSFFVSENIRMDILERNALTLLQADPEHFPGKQRITLLKTNQQCVIFVLFCFYCKDLPHEVDNYHDLYPLEPMQKAPMGYPATMYKATHIKTGVRYCLRRIHGNNHFFH